MTEPRRVRWFGAMVAAAAMAPLVAAQQAPPAAPEDLYRQYAPIDLTGTWVSIVTEDWAVRMITPPKGDFESLPLTPAARDAANRADLAQLEAGGRACDAYGAPALLRQPGRLRISWQDGQTLRLDMDAGEQTRLLHFDPAAPRGAPSRQGFSAAEWQYANGFDPLHPDNAARGGRGGRGGGRGGAPGRGAGAGAPPAGQRAGAPAEFTPVQRGRAGVAAPMGGRLKVVTDNLAAGLLRKNGVPYSAETRVTEYFNLLAEPDGTEWFVVTTVVHDPENLQVDYIMSTNFRKEPDGSKWRPQPCSLR